MTKERILSAEAKQLLGKVTDLQWGEMFGMSRGGARAIRLKHGISSWRVSSREATWTPERLALLGTATDREVAAQLGMKAHSVTKARSVREIPSHFPFKRWSEAEVEMLGAEPDWIVAECLGVPIGKVRDARRLRRIPAWTPWTEHFVQQLGRVSDGELAEQMGIRKERVRAERIRRGVPRLSDQNPLEGHLEELGQAPDSEIAARYGVTMHSVAKERQRHGIPSNRSRNAWTKEEVALLGKFSDAAVAKMTGRNRAGVKMERHNRRIPGIDPRGALRLHKEACGNPEAPLR